MPTHVKISPFARNDFLFIRGCDLLYHIKHSGVFDSQAAIADIPIGMRFIVHYKQPGICLLQPSKPDIGRHDLIYAVVLDQARGEDPGSERVRESCP